MTNSVTNEEIKEIVIARLKTIPDKFKIAIGNQDSFTKEQIINEVMKESETGKKMIDIQMRYLRSLKDYKYV